MLLVIFKFRARDPNVLDISVNLFGLEFEIDKIKRK